jgi:hypothetical protein
MKIRVLLTILLVFLPAAGFAKAPHRCHMCGMDSAKSQTEFVALLDDGTEEHTCSLHCVYILEKLNTAHKITNLETRDFTSGSLIDARSAHYMKESSLIPKGSMAPFLFAFSNKEDADKYAQKYKGTIVTFDDAMALAAQFDRDVACKKN